MKYLKYGIRWFTLRVILLTFVVVWPLAAVAALPWAWFSDNQDELCSEMIDYFSSDNFTDIIKFIFSKDLDL